MVMVGIIDEIPSQKHLSEAVKDTLENHRGCRYHKP